MKQPFGLRTQLLLGLVLIILVTTVSVGAITAWATRWQVTETKIAGGQLLGQALARLLAQALGQQERSALRDVLVTATAGTMVRQADLVDDNLVVQASNHLSPGTRLADRDLLQTMRTEQQTIHVIGEQSELLIVSTPLFQGGALKGALRLHLFIGGEALPWPTLFWLLMGIDGLLIVVFVVYVLTRYVIQPVEAMQRAALQVTQGQLSVTLPPGGAKELDSLAASFNTMTASVQDQLQRLEQQRLELAASREQIIRSEKLASVGRLAAGVAHEVGNPLQSIIGFADMLLRVDLGAEQAKDFLRRLQGEAERIHHIIRELLDYARPIEDAIEAVTLQTIVEQALQLVGPQKKLREVQVEHTGLEDLPVVAANASRMVQVLVNLLLNAADAIDRTGTITFRGEHVVERGLVRLHISNTGAVIPLEDRGRIFDPFFTTKEPGEGTGLGLSVAQSIVESYGGRLHLDESSERTTFVITLHRWQPTTEVAG